MWLFIVLCLMLSFLIVLCSFWKDFGLLNLFEMNWMFCSSWV